MKLLKKLWFPLILIILIVILLLGTCKKTNALSSVFQNTYYTISERNTEQFGFNLIIDASNSPDSYGSDILYINGLLNVNGSYNITIFNNNTIRLNYYDGIFTMLEEHALTSRLLQFTITQDSGSLRFICYSLNYELQQMPGVSPSISNITRTMIFMNDIGSRNAGYINSIYTTGDLSIRLSHYSDTYAIKGLINACYIPETDNDPTIINNWTDNQLTNYLTFNSILNNSYEYGYSDGYDVGVDYGESVGFDDGYDAGYSAGEQAGEITGYDEGFADGKYVGYNEGYDDGQAGANAISPVFNVISSMFTAIGTVLAIELVPHIPLGLFFLVPLFFAVLGLVLWIWRRN